MNCGIIPVICNEKEYCYVSSDENVRFAIEFCSFFVGKNACVASQIIKEHSYEFELRIILDGVCELRSHDNKITSAYANHFLTIPKSECPEYNYLSDNCMQMVILFDYVPLDTVTEDIHNVIYNQLHKFCMYSLSFNMSYLANIIKNNSELHKNDCHALISTYLFALFTEATRIIVSGKTNYLLPPYNEPRIEKAVRYIEKNISSAIDTADVAKAVFLSDKQLKRLFLSRFGCTVSEYIKHYKYILSRRLLEETTIPISEIAEQTGFSESTSFSRFFKCCEGVSPATFRARSKT